MIKLKKKVYMLFWETAPDWFLKWLAKKWHIKFFCVCGEKHIVDFETKKYGGFCSNFISKFFI